MPFDKGASGNPSGRPRGLKDRRTLFAEMLDEHKQQLFDKAVELALGGDPQMLRLLLDRLLPAKPKDNPISELELQGSAQEKAAYVIDLLSAALISPSESSDLLQAISTEAKLVEVEEIKNRLIAIENVFKHKEDR